MGGVGGGGGGVIFMFPMTQICILVVQRDVKNSCPFINSMGVGGQTRSLKSCRFSRKIWAAANSMGVHENR